MSKGNKYAKPPLSAREINQEKLEAFAQAYMTNGFNKCKAAITAGYAAKTAQARSSEIFKNPYVVKRIKEIQEQALGKFNNLHERLTKELEMFAFIDIGKVLEEDNDITDIKKLKASFRRQVKSIKKTVSEKDGVKKTTVQVDMIDKLSAITILGKHTGYFEKDNEQKRTVSPAPVIGAMSMEQIQAAQNSQNDGK